MSLHHYCVQAPYKAQASVHTQWDNINGCRKRVNNYVCSHLTIAPSIMVRMAKKKQSCMKLKAIGESTVMCVQEEVHTYLDEIHKTI